MRGRIKKKLGPDRKSARKTKSDARIFPDEWIQRMRQCLADMEANDIDKPNKAFSKMGKMFLAYRCLATIAIEYAPPKLLSKMVVDAERICNRMGSSLIRDGDEVTMCLTKRHDECTGSYVNPIISRTIICKCKCHLRKSLEAGV